MPTKTMIPRAIGITSMMARSAPDQLEVSWESTICLMTTKATVPTRPATRALSTASTKVANLLYSIGSTRQGSRGRST